MRERQDIDRSTNEEDAPRKATLVFGMLDHTQERGCASDRISQDEQGKRDPRVSLAEEEDQRCNTQRKADEVVPLDLPVPARERGKKQCGVAEEVHPRQDCREWVSFSKLDVEDAASQEHPQDPGDQARTCPTLEAQRRPHPSCERMRLRPPTRELHDVDGVSKRRDERSQCTHHQTPVFQEELQGASSCLRACRVAGDEENYHENASLSTLAHL